MKHKHEFVSVNKEVRLYAYDESGSSMLSAIDKITGWKCKCGYTVATELERRLV